MKRFILLFAILLMTSSVSFAQEDNAFLTGKIQSAEFLKNANQFVIAIIMGDDREVERLLKLGANPNERYSRVPVIYFAGHMKYDKIMNLLLEYGADPDTTFMRESILKYSIFRKCSKCVSNLISYGADVNQKNFGCMSPVDFALKMKDEKSAELLIQAGAKTTKKTNKLMKKLQGN